MSESEDSGRASRERGGLLGSWECFQRVKEYGEARQRTTSVWTKTSVLWAHLSVKRHSAGNFGSHFYMWQDVAVQILLQTTQNCCANFSDDVVQTAKASICRNFAVLWRKSDFVLKTNQYQRSNFNRRIAVVNQCSVSVADLLWNQYSVFSCKLSWVNFVPKLL